MSENIKLRVLTLRKRLGLSQQEFAARLRASRNYISMIEGGRAPGGVFLRKLIALEQSLGDQGSEQPVSNVSEKEAAYGFSQSQGQGSGTSDDYRELVRVFSRGLSVSRLAGLIPEVQRSNMASVARDRVIAALGLEIQEKAKEIKS